MKLSRLQPDDWVLWWHPRKQYWVPLKVTIRLMYEYLEHEHTDDPSDIKPLEITEELLLLNGYKKEELIPGMIQWISDDGRVILRDDKNYINSKNNWSIHVDSPDMSSICNAELSYLHELQHILKHCEIEKELKPK